MQEWLQNLVKRFTKLTWGSVLPYIILLAAAVVLVILLVKKSSRKCIYATAGVMVAALAAALAIQFPTSSNGGLELDGTQMNWFYSPAFWIGILCIVGLAAIVMLVRQSKWSTQMLVSGALCVALSFILSCIVVYRLPQGGSVTAASMLPIMLFSWIYGPVAGICAGLVHGILQMVQGVYIVHPLQLLLDYVFPFAVLGLAGFIRSEKLMPLSVAAGGFARFLMHFLSGFIFFASYAPEGQAPIIYSLVYTASYMLPDIAICLVIVCIPQLRHALTRLRQQLNAPE